MKRQGKVRAGSVLVALMVIFVVTEGSGAPPEGSRPASLSRVIAEHAPTRSTMPGAHGITGAGAFINFSQTAEAVKESGEPLREPRVVPPPGTLLQRGRPVPESQIAKPDEQVIPPVRPTRAVLSPLPNTNFLALLDNGRVIPPDTNGAVGPNHVMTVLNSDARIQDRAGNVLSTIPVRAFWQDLLNDDEDVFDPKTYYDSTAKRWLYTVNFIGNIAASRTAGFLVAASDNEDPTGNWRRYVILVDDTAAFIADQSRFGFNKNALVVQTNVFRRNGLYVTSLIVSLEKPKVYDGTLSSYVYWLDDSGLSTLPAISHDANEETTYLLEVWNGNSSGRGFLRLSTITGVGENQILSLGVAFPASSAIFGYSDSGAPQKDSPQRVDTGDTRVHSVILRNGMLWAVHTAFRPESNPVRSSILWWRINKNGITIETGLIDDPAGEKHYTYPSLAINKNNDVLIGMSRFSASEYASAGYALRLAGEATFQSEFIYKPGEAPYFKTFSSTRNRWGDYSSTVVDPVDDTAFWTIQEYAGTPQDGQSQWGTWWAQVGGSSQHIVDARNDDVIITSADPLLIDVLQNDADDQGHALTITQVSQGLLGTVTINAGATVTYTPGAEFTAGKSDSFTYIASDGQGASDVATVTVRFPDPNNRDPIASDDAAVIRTASAVTIPVLDNDSDLDGDSLTVFQVEQGEFGSVAITTDNKGVIYTPGTTFDRRDSFTYVVSDGRGGVATATVNVKLIRDPKGKYQGGIADDGGQFVGFIKVVLTRGDKLTASVRLGSRSFSVKGYLVRGESLITTPAGDTVSLKLSEEDGFNVLSGEVRNAGGSGGKFSVSQNYYDSTHPAPQHGKYTLVAFNDSGLNPAPDFPQGTTWARLSISKSGGVSLAGKMGDGTPLSASASVTESPSNPHGETQLFVSLYAKLGSLSGALVFAPEVSAIGSDFSGTMAWRKPPISNGKVSYPKGFVMPIDAFGSRFIPASRGQRVLDWDEGDGQGMASCVDGSLPSEFLEKEVTLGLTNKITINDPSADRMVLKIDPKTGLLTGSFVIGGQTTRTAISGIAYQKLGGFAAGFFIGRGTTRAEDQSGQFMMSPERSDIQSGVNPQSEEEDRPITRWRMIRHFGSR